MVYLYHIKNNIYILFSVSFFIFLFGSFSLRSLSYTFFLHFHLLYSTFIFKSRKIDFLCLLTLKPFKNQNLYFNKIGIILLMFQKFIVNWDSKINLLINILSANFNDSIPIYVSFMNIVNIVKKKYFMMFIMLFTNLFKIWETLITPNILIFLLNFPLNYPTH